MPVPMTTVQATVDSAGARQFASLLAELWLRALGISLALAVVLAGVLFLLIGG